MLILNWIIYFIWGLLIFGSIAYSIYGVQLKDITKLVFLLVIPIASFLVFSYVFIFNRGSSVAQLSASRHLWSVWFDFWIPLSIGNLLCIVVTLACFFRPPYIYKKKSALILKFSIIFALLFTIYHVIGNMPDA